MTGVPRLLVIMGSGETSPTMARIHRQLFARLGSSSVRAVVLDTPVGFQENADDVSARALAYFSESVGRQVSVASFRSAEEIGSVEHETMLNRLRHARYIFSGPGSPSYALDQWRPSLVPAILAEKLRSGGCLTLASAAAVTLGPLALPVYEIYKVGQAPHWIDGLDLMAETGLPAVVIPHFDNAEGGTHDTRYCYMGERRLARLEAQMPEDLFVLGVDEHTACILDLDAGTASVAGRGAVTVRRQGRSQTIPAGETVDIAHVRDMATVTGSSPQAVSAPESAAPTTFAQASPLMTEVAGLQRDFEQGLSGGDPKAAVNAILALEQLLLDWSRDTLQSDERDRGRAALRSMLARLGAAADHEGRDLLPIIGPLVEPLLEVRARARSEGRWADADAIRDRLVAAGVEVHDTAEGTTWDWTQPPITAG